MTPAFLGAVLAGGRQRAEAIAGASLPDPFPGDISELEFLRGRLRAMVEDPRREAWVAPRLMVLRDERRTVGHLGFHGPPGEDGCVEVGYGVLPADRGRGYAAEACQALFAWAVRSHGVTRFRAAVSPANAASLAVVRRLGFRQTGVQQDPLDGDELVFEMELDGPPRQV